ncbi:MAG: pilus assembly protein [Acidimicrobiia bacterium]|nr:pilus assembly protein [Acidimicrobiia bacterium]
MKKTDGGATIVEFAIVMPLLLLLMIGIMEVGVAFYDYLTVERSTLEGVRTASFTGDDLYADCLTINTIVDSFPGGFLDRVQQIEIYKFDPVTSQQDLSKTNIWQYLGGDPTDCVNSWFTLQTWPSTVRYTTAGPSQPLDIIGVRIRMPRTWISNFPPFTGGYTIDEHSILRLEPEVFE